MQKLRTIIFDLGNVLVPFEYHRGYTQLEALTGLPASEIPGRIRESGLVPMLESGQVEPRDFVAQLSRELGCEIPYERFCEIWSSIFLPHELVPESLVQKLKEDYRIIVLSNTNAIHFDMIRENYPILRHFDHLVLSHEVRAMKPDPVIYAAAIEHAQAEPGECFFTDDIAEYVEGARRAGIQAEQFLGVEKLLGDLRGRGVAV